MKNLCYLLVVLAGCSSTGNYPRLFAEDAAGDDSGVDSGTDVDTDTDTDTDTDSGFDAGFDSGADAGEISCDGGACCTFGGDIAISGTPCILDDLPAEAATYWTSAGQIPQQFRCMDEDMCGSGEERRAGQVVCGGVSQHCKISDIVWGDWEVTVENLPSTSLCYAGYHDIVWLPYLADLKTDWPCYGTGVWGCEEGVCIPGPAAVEGEECDYLQCGEYCVANPLHDTYNCKGSCGYNCLEHGGSFCAPAFEGATEPEDTECRCGEHPACAEGYRCVADYILADTTCIPE
jgi:hypothetical protein